jgi:WhiB family transcriptional regulator, redox-sensing transcriptional regulator
VTNLSWRQKAACRGLDPEIFYPTSDDAADSAKIVCSACAVRTACLEYALSHRENDGIWGGATEKERRRIVRQRRKSA